MPYRVGKHLYGGSPQTPLSTHDKEDDAVEALLSEMESEAKRLESLGDYNVARQIRGAMSRFSYEGYSQIVFVGPMAFWIMEK